ncbi:MAG: reverse transcriptase domain-containing protein [Pseudobdellovibrionaceae bacterium]
MYGPKENEFIAIKQKEMLDQGIIRKSKEANVSPVVVAHHPRTKKMRFCVNYQKLNKVTIRENHIMPRVWDTLQILAGSDWFSSIDLLSGFWQVPIAEEDVHLTAFISNEGIFEFLFMPFGLVNAPFTFQELMDDTLGDLKPKVAVPYLDDLNCHSAGSPMEHVEKVKLVLDKLLEAGLRPNWEKCKFLYPELDCFGHIVTKNGVRIDPTRLERLKGIKKLGNVHDVRLFLGLCCVYYRFIKNYAILAEPLIRLTRKDVPWRWTSKEIEALESLKKSVINATFLSIPRADLPFRIRMDSSDSAAGYYLYQEIL